MSSSDELEEMNDGETADGYESDEESEFDEDEEDKKTEALKEILKNTSFVMPPPPPISAEEAAKSVSEDDDEGGGEPDAIEASLVLQIVSSNEDGGPANVKVRLSR